MEGGLTFTVVQRWFFTVLQQSYFTGWRSPQNYDQLNFTPKLILHIEISGFEESVQISTFRGDRLHQVWLKERLIYCYVQLLETIQEILHALKWQRYNPFPYLCLTRSIVSAKVPENLYFPCHTPTVNVSTRQIVLTWDKDHFSPRNWFGL